MNILPTWPEAVTRTLDNGLDVVCVPLPHLHLTSIVLFVRVGSRFEARDDNGISHLLEHVLFRGCEAFPDTYALNSAIETIGTGLDAATSRDFTTFEATCLPSRATEMLEIIGAMISSPLMTGVDVERRIITEELQDEIDARGKDIDADNLAKLKMFPSQGLGWKVGGTLARIAKLSDEDCRRWHARHYTGANMVLAVTGPVDPERIVATAARALGGRPQGERITPHAPRPRPDLPAFEFVRNPGSQVDLELTWALPAEDHPDWPALLLVQRLLDDGTCARLRHRVVDQLGLAYHAGADLEVYDQVTIMTVASQTRPSQVVPLVDAMLETLDGLATGDIPDVELDRMRSRLALELGSAVDSPSATAYWFGLERLYPAADSLAERHRRAMAVTVDQIRHVVTTHLDRKRCQLTVVGELDPIERATLRRRLTAARNGGAAGEHAASGA
ncbi:MAG: insulinase family protein [Deltaproteobacteria bacterium]|nr:insulinase family protein [Deltaproteobacteria bacterium]